MINGAIQIVGRVPGQFLDPLLLAQSQLHGTTGYVLVAYAGNAGFYDLLFFRGSTISDCCRMNANFRFMVTRSEVQRAFETHRQARDTLVSLYEASPELTSRFLSTFHYQPCLKLKLDPMSRKQISKILPFSGCSRGIIERNDFNAATPSISLTEFDSAEALAGFQPDFRHGTLLLYDIEKNQEADRLLARPKPSLSLPSDTDHALPQPRFFVKLPEAPESHSTVNDSEEREIDEFHKLVQQIISKPPSDSSASVTAIRKRGVKVRRRLKSDATTALAQSAESTDPPGTEVDQRGALRSPRPNRDAQNEYTMLFERLFRSFRQQAFEVFGQDLNSVIENGERELCFLNPDFKLRSLEETTAVSTLDLVAEIVRHAPFLKRSKLRNAALTLVADLYNRNYDVLDSHRDLGKVEEFYCKLKG
jgi:hypothetical protein